MKKHILLFILLSLLSFIQIVWGQTSVTYSSSDTWICPDGVTTVTVECWGGGGPGGNGKGTSGGRTGIGGGGAGGAYAKSTISVTPGTSYTVTVGAQQTVAFAGNPSWFGSTSTVFAAGGANGLSGIASSSSDNFGARGTGSLGSSIGTVLFKGGNGFQTTSNSSSPGGGGSAGNASDGNSATDNNGAGSCNGRKCGWKWSGRKQSGRIRRRCARWRRRWCLGNNN